MSFHGNDPATGVKKNVWKNDERLKKCTPSLSIKKTKALIGSTVQKSDLRLFFLGERKTAVPGEKHNKAE